MTRADRLDALRGRAFDLLVVGGGITGCGIARDAALRGLSVALVEKDDFASGTSSRSSRLVHGGVRYLEHGHLHLVFESSAERRRLLRLAPHLVRPLQFTWPVYSGARIPRWKLGAGLMLYDTLALFRNVGRHRRLSARRVLANEPALSADGLKGGASYFDAATNDARLTLANAIAAAEAGAIVRNYAMVTQLTRAAGRLGGAVVQDTRGNEAVEVRAAVVVNATGPWSDRLQSLDDAGHQPTVRGSKGVHIAVARERIDNRHALTLLSPRDGRVLFALPGGPTAIIGTTDTYTSEGPDDVRATRADVEYLLDSANTFFPNARLTCEDVIASWAGIRPLLPTASNTPGSASREHAISTSASGLVTITGGKLTTYRVMAAQVVDAVMARLGRPSGHHPTEDTPLPGGDFRSYDDLVGEIVRTTNDLDLATRLADSYGSRWRAVWNAIEADGRERLDDSLPYTIGEMRYAARSELALTLGDLLIRRTHLAFETRDHGTGVASRVAEAVAPLLGWSAEEQRRAVEEYGMEVERIFGVGERLRGFA
ncbi:MAG TPA: glycerol-3-phosphate dehydrogenase [Gemmatimonadaceae bacterium]|nr:glycerol-3-phosphate dehydrogenase [Gemmatimonadaceae bacterium]